MSQTPRENPASPVSSTAWPMISAVMPSYNQAKYLREALDSILSQNYPNLEVIVMDGGSTDGSVDILKSYGEKISWVSEKDKSQSDAINKGLKKARGDIIAWLNSDDVYFEGAFLAIGRYFAQHADVMWLFGRAIIIDQDSREIRRWVTRYKNFFLPRYSYDSLLAQNYISQMAVFFRREAVNEIGYIDESLQFAMDYDYWLRMGAKYKPAYLPQYFGKFRLHNASKTIADSKLSFDSDFSTARKYSGGKWHLILFHKIFHLCIIVLYPLLAWAEEKRNKQR